MVKILLLGTHEYNWCLQPFTHLYKKYWGSEFIYVTDRLIKSPDFECIQVPAYSEGIWNWKIWFAEGLYSILNYFDENLFTILLLDHWLNKPVKVEYVNMLAEYMSSNNEILRGNLTADTCLNLYGEYIRTYKELDLITVPKNSLDCSYGAGITFCPSIFNKENLFKIMNRCWNFWELENVGTKEMLSHKNLLTIGTKQSILSRVHALSHHNNFVNMQGLPEEDKSIIKEMIPDGWQIK